MADSDQPATWQATTLVNSHASVMAPDGKHHFIFGIDDEATEEVCNFCERVAKALNAEDIMLRTGLVPIQYYDGTWGVQNRGATFPKGLGGQGWPHPFTAIVLADHYIKEQQP